MTVEKIPRFAVSHWQDWVWLVLVAAVAVTSVVGIVEQRQFSWWGVLLGLAVAVLIFVLLAARNALRLSRVRQQFPSGYIAQLIVYSELVEQWAAIQNALGGEPQHLRSSRYATVAADKDWIRLFGGGGKPAELARLPTSAIGGISIASAQQGNWRLKSLELNIQNADAPLKLDLCLVKWSFVFPHVIRTKDLQKESAALSSATTKPARI